MALPSFSEAQNLNLPNNARNESETINSVTSQLLLKSSSSASAASHRAGSQTLDKDVVLRRIRHHKSMNKIRNAFQALLAVADDHADAVADKYEQKWLQLGDAFSSP
ncbi:hypothetical protein ACH5RR_014115 [Cinchona calisaya]|uniref:Uncharacterized protein n=1 Tax=Cinchona calisaya TaxID=153742 RepID=A0ABD3A3H2_9GENT